MSTLVTNAAVTVHDELSNLNAVYRYVGLPEFSDAVITLFGQNDEVIDTIRFEVDSDRTIHDVVRRNPGLLLWAFELKESTP